MKKFFKTIMNGDKTSALNIIKDEKTKEKVAIELIDPHAMAYGLYTKEEIQRIIDKLNEAKDFIEKGVR